MGGSRAGDYNDDDFHDDIHAPKRKIYVHKFTGEKQIKKSITGFNNRTL